MAFQETVPRVALALNPVLLLSLGRVVEEQACASPQSPASVLLASPSAGLGAGWGGGSRSQNWSFPQR